MPKIPHIRPFPRSPAAYRCGKDRFNRGCEYVSEVLVTIEHGARALRFMRCAQLRMILKDDMCSIDRNVSQADSRQASLREGIQFNTTHTKYKETNQCEITKYVC